MEFCHNCGKQNDESHKFCVHCGVKLIKKSLKCVKCGKLNEDDSNFCIYCGTNLKNNKPLNNVEFKEKVENNSSDLGVIYLGGTTIDNTKIEKNTPEIDSNNVKSKSIDNGINTGKNLKEKLDDTNIENHDVTETKAETEHKHTPKKIKKEQNTLSENTAEMITETPHEVILLPEVKTNNHDLNCKNKLKENNIQEEFEENIEFINYSDSEMLTIIEKILDDSDEIKKDSHNIKSKSNDNEQYNNKNLNENLGKNIEYNSAPDKKEEPKQRFFKKKIEKEQNTLSKNTKEIITETQSEVNHIPAAKTINCNYCGSKLLNDDPVKICKSCLIRISNYLDLLCEDFEINTKVPLKNIYRRAEKYKLSRKDTEDITTTLMKYNYLHKINGEILIDYNKELRNFIDKYSTKTVNKTDNIENNVNLVAEKIGLNTPFNITYLKETLNFKNSEISKMIKYLDEKNAIIEDGDYYILIDKSN